MSKNNLLARRKTVLSTAPSSQAMGIVRKNPDIGTVSIVNSIRSLRELPVNGPKRITEDVLTGIGRGIEREEYRNSGIEISEYECMYW